MDVAAIVPAAGAGRRLQAGTRKPFVVVNGQPLLVHALRILQQHAAVRWIILAVRSEDRSRVDRLVSRYRITKALAPCLGGPSRAASVAKALAAVPQAAKWILVHDAARPCLSAQLLSRALRAATRYGAVACGLPATLTVKAVDQHQQVRLTLDRDRLWLLQTPQVFRRDWFEQAIAQADHQLEGFSDDAALLEAAGFPVRLIPGDPLNVKVTTTDDLFLAEAILRKHRSE